MTQPWRTFLGQIVPPDPHPGMPTLMRPWTLDPGLRQLHPLRAMPFTPRKWSLLLLPPQIRWRLSITRALTNEENILPNKRSTLSPSRPTRTMGNAGNCGSMRSTTTDSPASGDQSSSITHCFFAHLITGGHTSTCHSKTKDPLATTFRIINFLWRPAPRHLRLLHWPLNYSSYSLVNLLPVLHPRPQLRQSLVASLRTSCKLSLMDFALWHPRAFWPHATEPTSKDVVKHRALPEKRPCYGRVCVCVANIWTDVKLLFHLGFVIRKSRGVQSTVETAPNQAIHLSCWKQSLINSCAPAIQLSFYFRVARG